MPISRPGVCIAPINCKHTLRYSAPYGGHTLATVKYRACSPARHRARGHRSTFSLAERELDDNLGPEYPLPPSFNLVGSILSRVDQTRAGQSAEKPSRHRRFDPHRGGLAVRDPPCVASVSGSVGVLLDPSGGARHLQLERLRAVPRWFVPTVSYEKVRRMGQSKFVAKPSRDDGDATDFAELHPTESFRLAALYQVADFDARRARFAAAVSEDSVRRHLRRLDLNQTLVVGAFRRGRMDAAMELHPFFDNWERAEIVFIGRRRFPITLHAALLDAAIGEARDRGCNTFYFEPPGYGDATSGLLRARCEIRYVDGAMWASLDAGLSDPRPSLVDADGAKIPILSFELTSPDPRQGRRVKSMAAQ
jgi:hypothetical protein